jgi:hypothetical protein
MSICSPICVFSVSGYEQLLSQNHIYCPICWSTLTIEHNLIVVIIDTCGEKQSDLIFGYNFVQWKKYDLWPNRDLNANPEQHQKYIRWSLANVLNRPAYNYTTPYYLAPTSAGVDVCLRVHED